MVATSFDQLIRELKTFDQRREIVKAMNKGIRATVPAVRTKIRAAALALLPSSGGLAKFVASARINLKVKTSGRAAGVRLVGGRNSAGGRTDMRSIDRGRVRAPSWGRRARGDWHTQAVTPGYFTRTAQSEIGWSQNVGREVDRALDQLRRG